MYESLFVLVVIVQQSYATTWPKHMSIPPLSRFRHQRSYVTTLVPWLVVVAYQTLEFQSNPIFNMHMQELIWYSIRKEFIIIWQYLKPRILQYYSATSRFTAVGWGRIRCYRKYTLYITLTLISRSYFTLVLILLVPKKAYQIEVCTYLNFIRVSFLIWLIYWQTLCTSMSSVQ